MSCGYILYAANYCITWGLCNQPNASQEREKINIFITRYNYKKLYMSWFRIQDTRIQEATI